ncbi:hypothetical protein DO97_20695 [Neosynechococcus sphagnicola sy1]|uniref:Uncharacterized protein n=1 Tax=Neosynechococcus sphagnicola sy1 TaxID=1497020 RepID=A0A098TFT1_9CYAN|nr:hypothetical protein [Neosynechococcus sphagnicola]KGF71410.1 hypothetical protein DO97_20695 [Neosynechococcus sphagnicola sy1]
MPKKSYGSNATPIDSVKHKDKRANIPTEELRGFVAEDEKKPKIVSRLPASSKSTVVSEFSVKRLATTQPTEPAPITM